MSDSWPQDPGQYVRALEELLRAKIDFVLCGGMACILHGVRRVTADLDLSIDWSPENTRRLVETARRMGLRLRVPEPLDRLMDANARQGWVTQKQAKVMTLVATDGPLQIDLLLDYPIPHEKLRERADSIRVGDITVPVSTIDDLIAAKQAVKPARKQDLRDIEDLREINASGRET